MQKIFYQWAGIGILSLIGVGVDMMPNNTSWVPSTILWMIAGIWFIGTLIYWFRHRNEIGNKNKESNPLEDIKNDLIQMNTLERLEANNKIKQLCTKETAEQIYADYDKLFNLDTFMSSLITRLIMNRDIDFLVNYFKGIGNIFDSNQYGIKEGLEGEESYRDTRTDLAQKRVQLKYNKKKMNVVQNNIDRVRSVTYGMNSHIILRKVFNDTPEIKGKISIEFRSVLENIEMATETVLSAMANDLESEWK